jgi:hypothetical protein
MSQPATAANLDAAPAGAPARRTWTPDTTIRVFVGAYIVLFFAYLFGPLIIMSITAFNSSSFPRAVPWECFTFEWFEKAAADQRLRMGLRNAAIIGAGVVSLSVTLGLAGALFLTQVWPRARHLHSAVLGPHRQDTRGHHRHPVLQRHLSHHPWPVVLHLVLLHAGVHRPPAALRHGAGGRRA